MATSLALCNWRCSSPPLQSGINSGEPGTVQPRAGQGRRRAKQRFGRQHRFQPQFLTRLPFRSTLLHAPGMPALPGPQPTTSQTPATTGMQRARTSTGGGMEGAATRTAPCSSCVNTKVSGSKPSSQALLHVDSVYDSATRMPQETCTLVTHPLAAVTACPPPPPPPPTPCIDLQPLANTSTQLVDPTGRCMAMLMANCARCQEHSSAPQVPVQLATSRR